MPYTFFPDAPGGTEIYVAELIAAMRGHGVQGMVAAPGPVDEEYEHNGIAVYRFARDAQERLAYAYGEPDESAAGAFRRIVQKLRPDIVHMHAHTAAVSERVADVAHECGARVVFTYHSPTVSCLRGTMMFEDAPCDGVLNVARCTVCSLQKNGVPPALGNIVAMLPSEIGKTTAGLGVKGAIATALRMKENTAAAHLRFASLMQKADGVVAVCQWVKDVLTRNGVPEEKVTLCRQGFCGPTNVSSQNHRDDAGVLRLAYFGRIDPIKGVDVLIEAIKGIPDINRGSKVYH